MQKKADQKKTVLVVGGGVAGISAALDLAGNGHRVHLVERGHDLGGQVARLDKFYPTDHCAFCPLWTEIRRCKESEAIAVHTLARVESLEMREQGYRIAVVKSAPVVDPELCINCGRCEAACPKGVARPIWEHAYPPVYLIEGAHCGDCRSCVEVCPTKAIAFDREERPIELDADEVIWAAGFEEVSLEPLKEYGWGTHPDILTSLEFEAWKAEAGENRGKILRRSDRSVPRSIAFIQCAGARDLRLLPHCSAVCCMHALKQAQWVKRRTPEVDCVILYTDLRTVGRDYYEYALRDFNGNGVRLVRGRPSMIYPLPGGGIAVRYEDTPTGKREIRKFDMVVLNGNLQSTLALRPVPGAGPELTGEGFVTAASVSCGFVMEPADVTESAIQASSAALRSILGTKG
ncbi:MAG TPA: FAD-dependent oxidoreductase [Syntrophales bacterium]|nr:FAD-dependent oxidoreductase [Syntrophales bacterium]